jgi:hypothetical protein
VEGATDRVKCLAPRRFFAPSWVSPVSVTAMWVPLSYFLSVDFLLPYRLLCVMLVCVCDSPGGLDYIHFHTNGAVRERFSKFLLDPLAANRNTHISMARTCSWTLRASVPQCIQPQIAIKHSDNLMNDVTVEQY